MMIKFKDGRRGQPADVPHIWWKAHARSSYLGVFRHHQQSSGNPPRPFVAPRCIPYRSWKDAVSTPYERLTVRVILQIRGWCWMRNDAAPQHLARHPTWAPHELDDSNPPLLTLSVSNYSNYDGRLSIKAVRLPHIRTAFPRVEPGIFQRCLLLRLDLLFHGTGPGCGDRCSTTARSTAYLRV